MRMLLHGIFGGINPYHKFLKDYCGRSVIDIGANTGRYTRFFLKYSFKVYAFEPTPESFKKLPLKAICYNVALGSGNKKIKFNYYKDSEQNSVLEVDNDGKYTVEVQQKKLDDYRIDDISLIKIDCQGMDYEVLLGSIETIKKSHPAILIEVDHKMLEKRGYSFNDINSFLFKLGYIGKPVYDCGTYQDVFYTFRWQCSH